MTEISVENLTRESDVIVIGDIKEVESRWNLREATIYTYTTFSVEKYIKGTGLETLTVVTEGGSKWGFTIWVEDVPVFTKNEKVLVFLKRIGREFRVVGWVQGKYTIKNGEVRGTGGKRTSLDDFLHQHQIENALPLSSSTTPPVETPEAPGFETLLGFLGLLAVRRMSMRF